MRRGGPIMLRGKTCSLLGTACLIVMIVLVSGYYPVHGAEEGSLPASGEGGLLGANEKGAEEVKPASSSGSAKQADEYGDVTEREISEKHGVSKKENGGKPSDEYGDVTEKGPSDEYGNVVEGEAATGEGAQIADPIEPWNRAMYHFNDKLYFWALKPVAQGWGYIVPEDIRGLVANFYQNIRAPIRIVNNLLQARSSDAGREFARLLINSTVGVAGLRDCAKECFGITGRDADFGQTLGKYGLGFGIYIVWPFIGPSSARDSAGFAVDWALSPTTYVIWPESAKDDLINPLSVILFAHNKVNYTSFHVGDYEALQAAAIDPYVAIRDFYAQYRKKMIKD